MNIDFCALCSSLYLYIRAQFSIHDVRSALRWKDPKHTHTFASFCVLGCRIEMSMSNLNIFLYLSVCLPACLWCVCLFPPQVQQCGRKCFFLLYRQPSGKNVQTFPGANLLCPPFGSLSHRSDEDFLISEFLVF